MASPEKSTFLHKYASLRHIVANNTYVFAIFLILFELVLSIFVYIYTCRSHQNHVQSQMANQAIHIEKILREVFIETEQVLSYIGNEISHYSNNDRHIIEKTLSGSSEIAASVKTTYSWTLLDWLDPRSPNTIINSQLGVIRNSYPTYYEAYIDKCRKEPWKLQLSPPIFGNTSGMWVIPAAMSVTDPLKKYMGTLLIGFNVAELGLKVQQFLPVKELSFVILDEDLRIVLQSTNNAIDVKSSFYRDMLTSNGHSFTKGAFSLKEPIRYKNIEYSFYKKPDYFPYFILIGIDPLALKREFWGVLLPRLFELYGMGLLCFFFISFSRKKILTKEHSIQLAKEAFRNRVELTMKNSLSSILTYSNVLLKHFSQEENISISLERQKEFMEKIYKEALNLYTMTTNNLNLAYVDITTVIENVLSIQSEYAEKKQITIKTFFEQPPLPFLGDEFRLKQIILGLTSLCIEYSPKKTLIKISASNKLIKGQQTLIILIEDNGFSLSAEDIDRLSEKFSTVEQDNYTLGGHLDLAGIKKLVDLHNGRYHIKNKSNSGKVIKLSLPYKTECQLKVAPPSNVHWLSSTTTLGT